MALWNRISNGSRVWAFAQPRDRGILLPRIITENGILTAKQMQCLSEAAEKFGNGNITFTSWLTGGAARHLLRQHRPFIDYVAGAGMVTGGT